MEQPNPSQASPDAELARLRAAVEDLEARVNRLEQGTTAVSSRISSGQSEQSESRIGMTTVNRVGGVTLAIGIIFFFKYAADNQWIGAGGLVLCGVLAGLLLIGTAEWLRRGQQAVAQGLAGCGCAILYISGYAAFGYYKLIPRELGFVGLIVASSVAIALCFRFASAAVAAVGFIGLFVAPLLARQHDDGTAPWLYLAYLFLLSVTSVATIMGLYRSIERRSALILTIFNAFWCLLTAWLLLDEHHARAFILSASLCAVVHFTGAFYANGRKILLAQKVFYLIGHGCLCTAVLRALDLWAEATALPENRASFTTDAESVFLALYGVLAIAYGVLRRSAINRLLGLVLLGIVVVKLYLHDVWLMKTFYRISAFVGLGVLLLAASFLYSRFKSHGETVR